MKNKINNWEEAAQPHPYLSKTGFSERRAAGIHISLGLFKDQQDVDMSPEQFGTVRPGDIKYKDVNGDGVITDDDKVPLFAYSGIPQFMYGFGAEVRYKNWTLNVLFKGTGNNYFLYGDKDGSKFDGYIPFNGGYKGNVLALAYNPANRWTSADYSGNRATENPNARFPRLSYGNNANNTKPSTFWKGNARYLRLQELSLNYNLHTPGAAQSARPAIHRLQIMCENLAVWDGVEIFRPRAGHADRARLPDPAPLLAADLPELLTRISPKNINYHEKSFIIPLALVGLLTASCNFLNVDDYFEDTFSEERIFESQYNIERYFNGAVNQLPKEAHLLLVSVPGATGSDEAVSCGTFYNGILDVSFPARS